MDAQNPAPGLIFHDVRRGERLTLNPDLTVTLETPHKTKTVEVGSLSLEQWEAIAALCFWGRKGLTLGEVGHRMARNYSYRHKLIAC